MDRVRAVALGVVYLLGAGLALRALAWLVPNPTTQALFGALVLSFVAARAGLAMEATGERALRRAARGAALGAGAISLTVAACFLWPGASLGAARPSATIVFGTAEAFATAYRDELWLRGLPLAFAVRARVPTGVAVAFVVAAQLAALALAPGAGPAALAEGAAAALAFALLWLRSGDGWAPIAAHFAWSWIAGTLFGGEILDLRIARGGLGGGLDAAGPPGWLAAAALALGAVAVALDRPDFRPLRATSAAARAERPGAP
jgi:hypothetical protein